MGNTGGLFEQIISLQREKFFQTVAGNEFVKETCGIGKMAGFKTLLAPFGANALQFFPDLLLPLCCSNEFVVVVGVYFMPEDDQSTIYVLEAKTPR